MASKAIPSPAIAADWRDFYALTKPRVMTLVIFTAICGLLAAPGSIHPVIGFTAILCISLGAAGSAALNQWYESDIDGQMKRTAARPIPSGRMDRAAALHFGIMLSVFSVLTMGLVVNVLSALILAFSIFFYAVAYTMWLKPSTPQNIVIGGAAGAFPPIIGWAAVTGDVTALPILMFLLIFIWTPPHFWALAMFVKLDYAKVGIPMMPVVAGERATRLQIFGYSVLLLIVAVAPWAMGLTGMVYGVPALVLTGLFLALATKVGFRMETDPKKMQPEKQLFAYSIVYLFVIFGFLAADRVLAGMA